jgi:hypothetical protein
MKDIQNSEQYASNQTNKNKKKREPLSISARKQETETRPDSTTDRSMD